MCFLVKPIHKSAGFRGSGALWAETRRLSLPWACRYISSWSPLPLLNVVIKIFWTPAGAAVGVCQNCLCSPDHFCVRFCTYFLCMQSGIKSWLETYSFYARITPIFSARGSSFFLTALLLVCWESLIACESFFCPPKLILFSKNFDFCLLNFTVWFDTCKHAYIGFRVALIFFFFVSIFFYRC